MTYHYHTDCDRCGLQLKDWDTVPDDWATIKVGVHSRELHFCPDCLKVLDEGGNLKRFTDWPKAGAR